jgi:hypothetical protein
VPGLCYIDGRVISRAAGSSKIKSKMPFGKPESIPNPGFPGFFFPIERRIR